LVSWLLKSNSLSDEFSALCGYTEKEIVTNFNGYLCDRAIAEHSSIEEIMHQMRTWYNGYRFSDHPTDKMYNPFSVLLYFKHQKEGIYFDYAQPSPKGYGEQPSPLEISSFAGLPAEAQESEGWFSTGTPTFLVKRIEDDVTYFAQLDHSKADSELLDSFEIDEKDGDGSYRKISLKTLLFQSGYLTIESYDQVEGTYTLTYPNQEIRESLKILIKYRDLSLRGV